MSIYYKLIFLMTILSLLNLWGNGYRANHHPEGRGYVSNKWNSDEYCCLYWDTKACWKQLEIDMGKPKCYVSYSLTPVSCLPKKPDFDWYEKDGCDQRFRGPEYSKDWCSEGDKWPDCVAESMRVKPRYKTWILLHIILLGLIASRSWLFTAYVALVLLNSY